MMRTRSFAASVGPVVALAVWAGVLGAATVASAQVRCTVEPVQDARLSAYVPSVVIPHMPAPPQIDGVLERDEWRGAAPIRRFLAPVTMQRGDPPTTAWLGVDDRNLYLAARCTLIPGVEPMAHIREHDGDVWDEDSVEFFIQPDGGKPLYYQVIVNAIGTSLDNRCTGDTPGSYSTNPSWNPAATVRTGREPGAWTLELAVPLSEIGIAPLGIKVVRLNICRNDYTAGGRRQAWPFLPQLNYHDLPNFGIGICTFGLPRGQGFDIRQAVGWSGAGLLRVDREKLPVLLPGQPTLRVRIALPDRLLADMPVFLEPRLAGTEVGGKAGVPVALGKFRLTSSAPVKLSVAGLEPGDYTLSVNVQGVGLSMAQDAIVVVRRPNVEPEITGRVVLEDHDWRNAHDVASCENIEREMLPELLLKTKFESPVLVFDPKGDETITCMTEFKGKLYAGSCTQPAATDTGSVFTYDPGLDLWEKVFQVNDQGLVQMKVYGERLYVPGYDANDGGWDLGNIYIHDGESWVERRTVPRAIHIYGLVKHEGRIYVSADIIDAPPEGMPFEEALSKDILECYGRVVSSGDEGLTWREEYRGPQPGQDVGFMGVFGDKIVLNARGDLIIYDGEKWTPLGLNPNVLCVYDYAQEGDTLLLGTSVGLAFYDGKQFRRSDRFKGDNLRALERYGSHWVLTGYYLWGGLGGHHGPGGTAYPDVKEDRATIGVSRLLRVVPADALDLRPGGPDRESKWWEKVAWINSDEVCVSSAACRGRVYLGTHPTGRVLALPVATEGTLDSAPRRIDEAGQLRLWWRGETPLGTSIRFQIRSAATVEELQAKPFVGRDGDPRTYFDSQGAAFSLPAPGFVQYRVSLTTASPARSPYLREVIFTRADS